jgi:hypothetical protein
MAPSPSPIFAATPQDLRTNLPFVVGTGDVFGAHRRREQRAARQIELIFDLVGQRSLAALEQFLVAHRHARVGHLVLLHTAA